jgi:hypothetical protein
MGIRNGLETVLRWGKYRRKMKKGLCDYLMWLPLASATRRVPHTGWMISSRNYFHEFLTFSQRCQWCSIFACILEHLSNPLLQYQYLVPLGSSDIMHFSSLSADSSRNNPNSYVLSTLNLKPNVKSIKQGIWDTTSWIIPVWYGVTLITNNIPLQAFIVQRTTYHQVNLNWIKYLIVLCVLTKIT